MYLSRVEIDLNNKRKLRELSHLGAYHNWVEQSFPDEFDRNEHSRKLWRIDKISNKEYLLILSENKPNVELMEAYGVNGTAQSILYDTFIDSLKEGMALRFKIVVNPVYSISTGKASGKRGKVYKYKKIDHQMEFFKTRSHINGFSLEEGEYYISESKSETLKKHGLKSEEVLKVTFEGLLTITDIDTFKKLLVSGLGKKKAYGCGLMTVIPL